MRLSLASKRSVVFLWVAPSNCEWSLSGVTSLSIKIRYLLEFHLQQVKLSLILVVVEIQTHRLVKYINLNIFTLCHEYRISHQIRYDSAPFGESSFEQLFDRFCHVLHRSCMKVMKCFTNFTSCELTIPFQSLIYLYRYLSDITPPLSFLTVAHPLGTNFVLSPSFRCCKNQRGSYNFHRDDTEHSSA